MFSKTFFKCYISFSITIFSEQTVCGLSSNFLHVPFLQEPGKNILPKTSSCVKVWNRHVDDAIVYIKPVFIDYVL